ncbi:MULTISPECIES: hypothetical protein [Burkholderiaceae]|uniref:hypothetical protein n=1 Tax=Burkholderiaceae TaxID=119060 RepID=UPI00095E74CE|nr:MULTISPECIES: hypothetical protein [Burkholderiaceae]MCG1018209.1 NAP domain-containing protein [Mycetohabitans sp. B4]SIT67054.1 hypothetical protein SAMN04487768_1045 [Burkholderia sp. b13]
MKTLNKLMAWLDGCTSARWPAHDPLVMLHRLEQDNEQLHEQLHELERKYARLYRQCAAQTEQSTRRVKR